MFKSIVGGVKVAISSVFFAELKNCRTFAIPKGKTLEA
jgi:hypothetical protein